MQSTSRDYSLDLIRAIAVTLVIFHHFFQEVQYSKYPPISQYLIKFFVNYGAFGVQLFFAVSGYIMISKYSNISSLRQYTLLRYTRLIPMLTIVVMIDLLISFLTNPSKTDIINIIPSILIIDPQIFNVIFDSERFHWVDNSFWTLFVEIRFYLIFGLLMKISKSLSLHRKIIFISTLCMFSQLLYITSGVLKMDLLHKICFWVLIPHYFIYFLFGIILYSIKLSKDFRLIAIICFLAAIFLFVQKTDSTLTWGNSFDLLTEQSITAILYFVFILIIFPLSSILSSRLPQINVISRTIGTPSYTSYLLHQNLFLILFPLFTNYLDELFFSVIFFLFVISTSFILSARIEPRLIRSLRTIIRIR
jgi:peptidoglycan/LPS O-acetylase OafA/YrhL